MRENSKRHCLSVVVGLSIAVAAICGFCIWKFHGFLTGLSFYSGTNLEVFPDGFIEVAASPTNEIILMLGALADREITGIQDAPTDSLSIRIEGKRSYLEILTILAKAKGFWLDVENEQVRIVKPHPFPAPQIVIGELSALDIQLFDRGDEPFGPYEEEAEDFSSTDESISIRPSVGENLISLRKAIIERIPAAMEPPRFLVDARLFQRPGTKYQKLDTSYSLTELLRSSVYNHACRISREGNTVTFRDLIHKTPIAIDGPLKIEINAGTDVSSFKVINLTGTQLLNLIRSFSGKPLEVIGNVPGGKYDLEVVNSTWPGVFEAAATKLGATGARVEERRFTISFPELPPIPPLPSILDEAKFGLGRMDVFRVDKPDAKAVDQLIQFREEVMKSHPELEPPIILIDAELAEMAAVLPLAISVPQSESNATGTAYLLAKTFAEMGGLDMKRSGNTLTFLPRP